MNDCPHRRWGSVVVVTQTLPGFDDPRTTAFDKTIPFVAIRSRDAGWTGWVESIDLTPIIPVGTRITFENDGYSTPEMYRRRDDPVGKTIRLGSPVTVQVLRQHPPDGNCELNAKVLTGPKAGLAGWTCDWGTIEGTKLTTSYLN